MDELIQEEYNKIKNLKQYQGFSEERLIGIATARVKKADKDLDVNDLFTAKEEKKLAKELLHKYLDDYVIETISDKNTLKQVVYLEVLNVRLQDILNNLHKDSKGVPLQLIDSIHKNIDAIVSLKEKLGLIRQKEAQEEGSVYSVLDSLKRKFKKFREENQASRFVPCEHCGKNTLLKIRIDAWEAQKHPFFKDKLLFNETLIRLYLEKKISSKDVGDIFGTSQDYTDWLVNKAWKTNPIYNEIEKEVTANTTAQDTYKNITPKE